MVEQRPRVSRLWVLGVLLGGIACLLLLVLPLESTPWTLVARGGAILALLVFVRCVARMPRGARAPWWALWSFAALEVAGDLAYDWEPRESEVITSVALSDVFYLTSYVAGILALILLIRRTQSARNREVWIDSTIITIAAIALATVVLFAPMARDAGGLSTATLLTFAYPVLDMLILGGLVRLLVGGERLRLPLSLVMVSFATYLTADLLYNASSVYGATDTATAAFEALYLAAIVILAAGAGAPEADEIAHPVTTSLVRPSSTRVLVLTVGVVTAPVLTLFVTLPDRRFVEQFLALCTIAIVLLALWRVRELLVVVDRQAVQLDRQARTDSLTGLPNRRTLDYEVERAVRQAERDGSPLTIGMIDLDHFKDYNDARGHQAGDSLLAACARVWSAAIPPDAFLARYGGEEFAVLVPGVSGSTAAAVMEELRRVTPSERTVSIGFAEHLDGETGPETIRRADRALYEAKDAGRDRVISAAG